MKLINLMTQYRRNPLGLDELPSFSWEWASDGQGAGSFQRAFRIQAADRPEVFDGLAASGDVQISDRKETTEQGSGLLWDSGKLFYRQPFGVPYGATQDTLGQCGAVFIPEGTALRSRQRVYWRVMAWDENDCPTGWSAPAWFEMGFLKKEDWQAIWIGREREKDATPLFRKEFSLKKRNLLRARLYGCGLGLYDVFLNGRKLDEDYFEPGDSDYRKTVYYRVWDVTERLRDGENALGFWLGNGQYRNYEEVYTLPERYQKTDGWREKDSGFYGDAKGIFQLELFFSDGASALVCTDESWQTADSPLLFSNWYGGEDYDAGKEIPDWCQAGCTFAGWKNAVKKSAPPGRLRAKNCPSIQVVEEWNAKEVHPIANGHYIVDMGKNCAGFPILILHNTTPDMAGQEIRMYPAEVLGKDGSVDQYTCTQGDPGKIYDTYRIGGYGEERWHPRFCYHGYRYLEVEGFPGTPAPENFKGCRLRTANEKTGAFATSDPVLGTIDRMITNSVESNMTSVFTDCPQIEKLGWLETTNLLFFSLSQSYDIRAWMRKIIQDVVDSQYENGYIPAIAPEFQRISGLAHDPNWSGVCALVPWAYYEAYADTALMTVAYPTMLRYIAYLEEETRPDKYILYHIQMGDWGAFDKTTPRELVGSCAFYNIVDVTAKTASLLGKKEDACSLRALADKIRASINRQFYHPQSGVYGSGSEASYACPLYAGVVEEENIPRTVALLVEEVERKGNHLSTGEVGLKQLLTALAQYGRSDVVYRIVTNRTQPSYWYFVEQGATSLPEYWDMERSQNHAMMGHVKEWLGRYLAGITPLSPGYASFCLAPYLPDDVTDAAATIQCPYGKITFSWKKTQNGVEYEWEVPFGTQARLILPGLTEGARIRLNGTEAFWKKEDSLRLWPCGKYHVTAL